MYITLILRCILFYFILIISLRLMGKREVGELSVFDIVIYLVMSELLALAVSDSEESIFKVIIPIITLTMLQITVSFVLLKSKTLRNFMDGTPAILIKNGILDQDEMRKQRYNIDDLMSQLRMKDICTIDDIMFAVLENNGSLSVIKKADCSVLHPTPLIQDGIINNNVLKELKKDKTWLLKELHKKGYNNISDIFICIVLKKSLFLLPKNHK